MVRPPRCQFGLLATSLAVPQALARPALAQGAKEAIITASRAGPRWRNGRASGRTCATGSPSPYPTRVQGLILAPLTIDANLRPDLAEAVVFSAGTGRCLLAA